MAAPTLILGEPLLVQEKSGLDHRAGKFLGLFLVLLGLSCVTLWALGSDEQQMAAVQPIEALGTATKPMPMARIRQITQPSSARNFMQPVQASKSPVVGFVDMVAPDSKSPEKGEEVIMPITRRDMMAAAALGAATFPSAAQAEEKKEEKGESFACTLARITRPFLGYGMSAPQAKECGGKD
jgi:hypothetical protein